MVVIIEVVFGCVDCVWLVLLEMHAPTDHLVISVLVIFCGLLANVLDTLDKAIMIAVRIVGDDTHSPVDLNNLLPVRQLPWTIKLNSFELIGISVSPLQFITSMLVEVSILLHS